ncbi:MAG: hypothetical protein SPLM_08870 [Spiroplasma phoeniceum]|uniref:hypothetical protein n=1 Tax=Spiroplasma phoeniceum TaxID=47835 RepID=UPI003133FB5E
MLPEKIDLFIDEHVDKPLSEYIIKENSRFILEFVNNLSWEEKFELINDFVMEWQGFFGQILCRVIISVLYWC